MLTDDPKPGLRVRYGRIHLDEYLPLLGGHTVRVRQVIRAALGACRPALWMAPHLRSMQSELRGNTLQFRLAHIGGGDDQACAGYRRRPDAWRSASGIRLSPRLETLARALMWACTPTAGLAHLCPAMGLLLVDLETALDVPATDDPAVWLSHLGGRDHTTIREQVNAQLAHAFATRVRPLRVTAGTVGEGPYLTPAVSADPHQLAAARPATVSRRVHA